MKCEECGTELTEGAKFCGVCGKNFTSEMCAETEETPKNKQKKKLSKKAKRIVIAVPCLILAILMIIGAVWLINDRIYIDRQNEKMAELSTAIKNRDLNKIKEFNGFGFNVSDLEGDTLSSFENALQCANEEIYNDFKNGDLTYEEAIEQLKTINNCCYIYRDIRNGSQQMANPGAQWDKTDEVEELYSETFYITAIFQKAKNHQDNGEYKLAIEEYKTIPLATLVLDDETLFFDACSAMRDCVTAYGKTIRRQLNPSVILGVDITLDENSLKTYIGVMKSSYSLAKLSESTSQSLPENDINEFLDTYSSFISTIDRLLDEYDALLEKIND